MDTKPGLYIHANPIWLGPEAVKPPEKKAKTNYYWIDVTYLGATDYPETPPEMGYVGYPCNVHRPLYGLPPCTLLTLSYAGEDITELGENNLRVFRHDPATATWSALDSISDRANRTLTAAVDREGIYAISALPVADTEAPKVGWLLPAPLAGITGACRLAVSAEDNVGTSKVEFYLGERPLGCDHTCTDGWWGLDVDLSKYLSGTCTLRADAIDRAGNVGSAECEIVLTTPAVPPSITMADPVYDSASRSVQVSGTASATSVKLDFVLLEVDEDFSDLAQLGDGTWSCALTHGAFGPGNHILTATATDEYGNTGSQTLAASLPLSDVWLHTDRLSPQLAGTPIALTAYATGGNAPQYQFEVAADGSSWTILRAFSYGNTWTWIPSAGAYTVRVIAREDNASFTHEVSYSIAPPMSGVNLSTDPPSPVLTGQTVKLLAEAAGGAAPEFRFEVSTDGTTWTVLQDYYWCHECAWTPTGSGTYVLRVTAREPGAEQVATDQEVCVVISPNPPALSKALADGTLVGLGPVAVVAVFPGTPNGVYVETLDRCAGLRVDSPGNFAVGDVLCAYGAIRTDLDGERYLDISNGGWIAPTGETCVLSPLGMRNRSVGGESVFQAIFPWDECDTSNLGMLVQSWGRITHANADDRFFYMNDGSGLVTQDPVDGTTRRGLRVDVPAGVEVPEKGKYVIVTGISDIDKYYEGKTDRVLRPRAASDLSIAPAWDEHSIELPCGGSWVGLPGIPRHRGTGDRVQSCGRLSRASHIRASQSVRPILGVVHFQLLRMPQLRRMPGG